MTRKVTAGTPVLAVCALLLLALAGCARPPGALGPAANGVTEEAEDWDPFQPFNERMFAFNHGVLDRFLIKPAATGWAKVFPGIARRSLARLLTNLEMPQRLVNNLLQARPLGAGRELTRFVLNTTVGVAGLIDVAGALDIEPSEADTGQTLALYGVAAGPFLVLPTMPPLTVRDAIGRGVDGLLDPIGYVLPFFANQAKSIVAAVNDRSLNLKLYADVEDSVLDLYAAARNGYLQRRQMVVRRAAADRNQEWRWVFGPARPDRPMTASLLSREDPA